jgi:hypothetical protein
MTVITEEKITRTFRDINFALPLPFHSPCHTICTTTELDGNPETLFSPNILNFKKQWFVEALIDR